MIVSDLIEKLKTFPPDATVIYQIYSDYDLLKAEDISFVKAEDRRIILHNGHCMSWNERWKPKDVDDPQFITAVIFPGN